MAFALKTMLLVAAAASLRLQAAACDDFAAIKAHLATVLLSRPRDPGKTGAGQISDFAGVRYLNTEYLAVLRDRRLDPELVRWLDRVKARFGQIADRRARATAIAKHVARTFKYGAGSWLHPVRRARYRHMTNLTSLDDATTRHVLLGKFLKNRTGVCRHEACALQLALQDNGVPSKLTLGEITVTDSADGEVLAKSPHAWVEVEIDGKHILQDPTQHRFDAKFRTAPGVSAGSGRSLPSVPRVFVEKTLLGPVQAVYVPHPGTAAGPYELGPRDLDEIAPAVGRLAPE